MEKEKEEKKEKEKKRRKSRNVAIDTNTGVMSGFRKVIRSEKGIYYVSIPREYIERHGLKAGDVLPFVGNHVLKFIPMKEME